LSSHLEYYKRLKPIIDGLRQVMAMFGLSESCAHVIATMYTLKESMSIDDLSQLTNYAKSTVFSCLNLLERLGFITKEKKGRRYLYKPISNPSDVIIDRLQRLLEKGIRPLIMALENILKSETDIKLRGKVHEILMSTRDLAKFLDNIIHECRIQKQAIK